MSDKTRIALYITTYVVAYVGSAVAVEYVVRKLVK